MADLHIAPSETTPSKPATSGRAPWIALTLALSAALSYVVSMLLPYYVNNLDRFPLEDLEGSALKAELWPADTAYAVPIAIAGLYAIICAPYVAGAVGMWSGFRLWTERRTMTHLSRTITVLAAAVSIATWWWLSTPLASALINWWLG
jgi:hypothetical protein